MKMDKAKLTFSADGRKMSASKMSREEEAETYAACKCIVGVNKELAKKNQQLDLVFTLRGDSFATVKTMKVAPGPERINKQILVATFCPFCGQKYERNP